MQRCDGRLPTAQDDVRVLVLHPDETVLDGLQFALEQAGLPTRALVPASGGGLTALRPYLPPRLSVAVVGLRPPYPAARAQLAALQQAYPTAALVLLASDPHAALTGWRGPVCPLIVEDGTEEQGVVQAVRTALRTTPGTASGHGPMP